jgi:CheY-like chemotaxis protein
MPSMKDDQPAASAPARSSSDARTGPVRVLVVDDEEFIRELVVESLASRGFVTVAASGGDEAMTRLGERPFDVLVTDVVMPGLHGVEFVRRVRREHPGTRVVVLTGFARQQEIGEFLLAGADDLLAKPFRGSDLVDVLRRVMARTPRRDRPGGDVTEG